MLQPGDGYVFLLLLLFFALLLWRPWKRRTFRTSDIPSSGKLVDLVEGEGYEIISGKVKIPLTLTIGEREVTSTVSADLLVKQHHRTYVVKTERDSSESLSAKRVRERYLAECLAFRAAGVIVVNADKTRVKQIDIDIRSPFALSRWRWGFTYFVLGVLITLFWLY